MMQGFAEHVAPHVADARLVLAGPSPAGVLDDPEGAIVLEQVRAARLALPAEVRRRVHLACLPMQDRSENAAIVNAHPAPRRRSSCRRASPRASG